MQSFISQQSSKKLGLDSQNHQRRIAKRLKIKKFVQKPHEPIKITTLGNKEHWRASWRLQRKNTNDKNQKIKQFMLQVTKWLHFTTSAQFKASCSGFSEPFLARHLHFHFGEFLFEMLHTSFQNLYILRTDFTHFLHFIPPFYILISKVKSVDNGRFH